MYIEALFRLLKEKGINSFYGVPDSLLKDFNSHIDSQKHCTNVITANEGNAIGFAIGSYLATEEISCVYLQNSGLGNAVNPLLSLADEQVMGIPMLMIIGWRGHPDEVDEPQHKKQGAITENLLKIMGIDYLIIDDANLEYTKDIECLIDNMRESHRPSAVLVKKGCLTLDKPDVSKKSSPIKKEREACIERILEVFGDSSIYFATTGYPSRELYEIIQRNKLSKKILSFYCVGGMGHVSSIAAGFSSKNNMSVVCLDGDGSLLMHMGSLGVISSLNLSNFTHIVFNNGCHESVGGQPTVAKNLNLSKIALDCGYDSSKRFNSCETFLTDYNFKSPSKTSFIEIVINKGTKDDLLRPKEKPKSNINYLLKKLH